jgi:hypothetical protein
MAKAPLAYVVREDVDVVPHQLDPPDGYITVQEELVARMPHTHIAYREDNIPVWDIIRTSINATEAYSWIKRCEKRRDGRGAYIALTPHYLGDAKNEAIKNAADNRILNTFYKGEKNRFNWTRYVSVHKECHNDLEATGTAMPEDDKVAGFSWAFRQQLYNQRSYLSDCRQHSEATSMRQSIRLQL